MTPLNCLRAYILPRRTVDRYRRELDHPYRHICPRIVAFVVTMLMMMMGGLVGCSQDTPAVIRTPTPSTVTTSSVPHTPSSVQGHGFPDVATVVRKVAPSVISVFSTVQQRDIFGRAYPATSSGSGVIFDHRGYILTNDHVVQDGKDITVVFSGDPDRFWPVEVVGTDQLTDIALLYLDPEQLPYELATTPLGDAENLEIGEWVIAIGSPLGFAGTVTVGVVSATGRSLPLNGEARLHDLIQTDAVINPGNSGGPLLNLRGEVIGINTAVIRGRLAGGLEAEGIGFAVSSSTVAPVAEQLIANGEVIWPGLGVAVSEVTPSRAIEEGLPSSKGILVNSIVPGGPAESAGIQALDIIVALDAKSVGDITELQRLLRTNYNIGDQVEVEILRKSERLLIIVTLERLSR